MDRLCEERASCSRSFSAVVVGVGTTLTVLDLKLIYLVSYIFCVVIIAHIVYLDYYYYVISTFHL